MMGGGYCVIFYVGIFLTPLFDSLSVQSLIYTLISLIFTSNSVTTICHHVLSRARCANKGGGGVNGWRRIFFLLTWNYARAKFNVPTVHLPVLHRGMGSRDPRIIGEYNLVTAILILPFTHPRTFKLGSFIFSDMSRLKLGSKTRDSLPIIPSTERKPENFSPLVVKVLTVLILIYFIPPRQEHWYWLIYVGKRISVAQFDVNNGFSLLIP